MMHLFPTPIAGPGGYLANAYRSAMVTLRVLLVLFALVVAGTVTEPSCAQTADAEIGFWETVKDSKDAAELQAYLDAYPEGKFAPLAKLRIEKLGGAKSTQPTSKPPATAPKQESTTDLYRSLNLFGQVIERIRADYYQDVNDASLIRAAIYGVQKVYPSQHAAQKAKEALAKLPSASAGDDKSQYESLSIFGEFVEGVREEHSGRLDTKKMMHAAIDEMLASLDPHSRLFDSRELKALKVQHSGKFAGIGAEVTMEQGVVKVIAPLEGSPSERAGIRAGDFITQVDAQPILGLTLSQAVEHMRGETGTPVELSVVREGTSIPQKIKVVRAPVRLSPVRYRTEGDVGYIRITMLGESVTEDFRKAVAAIDRDIGPDIKGYIIDLRNCPGGLLDRGIEIVDDLLDRGEIVQVKTRRTDKNKRISAKEGEIAKGRLIAVLINGGTSSGAEIVASALQDNKRGTLIGTRTFGKATVQTILTLDGGWALRLTTAEYVAPSGRLIQAKGIEPDVHVEQVLPDAAKGKSNSEADLKKHLPAKDGVEKTGSSAYVPKDKTEDAQLQHALKLLSGSSIEELEEGKVDLRDLERLD